MNKPLINCLVLLVVISTFTSAYDVFEEIKELKKIYGERVPVKACAATTLNCKDRSKRFLLSDTYCDRKLGCFPTNGDFSERIVNFKPNSRETINTKFTLFTKANPTSGQRLNADDVNSISKSLFDSAKKTKIVCHGFLESTSASWFAPMTSEFMKNGDYNVITVDWGGLRASKTLYTQATANTRVVAAEIVYLLKMLQQYKSLSLNDVHLIGHSLGSHISGYVGQNLTGAIGRITGMDPAEPYFQGYGVNIRLDPTDAKFVDIIHSDADSILEIVKGEGGLGSSELSGHADFFPNGGEDQPNCKNGIITNLNLEGDLYEGLKRFVACDHDRAIKYFTSSINKCDFTGILCSNYNDYENGKCSISCDRADQCNALGLHSHKPASRGFKKYYLHTTGDDNNFCATGYHVDVKIDSRSSEFYGSLDLTLTGQGGLRQEFPINKDNGRMSAASTHTYQIGMSTSLRTPKAMTVKWVRDVAWYNVVNKACTLVGLCNNSIMIKEILLTDSEGNRYYFCGNGKLFRSGIPASLTYSSTRC